jgi:hypothetical protein
MQEKKPRPSWFKSLILWGIACVMGALIGSLISLALGWPAYVGGPALCVFIGMIGVFAMAIEIGRSNRNTPGR